MIMQPRGISHFQGFLRKTFKELIDFSGYILNSQGLWQLNSSSFKVFFCFELDPELDTEADTLIYLNLVKSRGQRRG